jgi:hypothetical protein
VHSQFQFIKTVLHTCQVGAVPACGRVKGSTSASTAAGCMPLCKLEESCVLSQSVPAMVSITRAPFDGVHTGDTCHQGSDRHCARKWREGLNSEWQAVISVVVAVFVRVCLLSAAARHQPLQPSVVSCLAPAPLACASTRMLCLTRECIHC